MRFQTSLNDLILFGGIAMANKKKLFMSITATAVIASAFFATDQADAATYKVQNGDTLWKIAQKHDVTVSDIKSMNNLSSEAIYPSQVLEIGASSNSDQTSVSAQSTDNTYTVQSGDSLSKIATKHNISLDNLMSWNNLTTTALHPGHVLVVENPNPQATEQPADVSYDVDTLISTAKSMEGVGYKWAGTSPSGFDCSGFIYYVYKEAGMDIGRQSTDGFYNDSYYIDNPQEGDLVFFKNTYKSGISHMGVYLGDGKFIHASTSKGVTISSVNDSYWGKHFDGYKRFN